MIYAAIACMVVSGVLFRWALSFKIDAAPVGSMIVLASVVIGIASVFLFGVSLGQSLW